MSSHAKGGKERSGMANVNHMETDAHSRHSGKRKRIENEVSNRGLSEQEKRIQELEQLGQSLRNKLSGTGHGKTRGHK